MTPEDGRGRPTTDRPADNSHRRDGTHTGYRLHQSRARRWAARVPDDLLASLSTSDAQPVDTRCDGRHHPGEPCDRWAACTGMHLDVGERVAAGREA